MHGCCVRGCRNQKNASAKVTFYRIPSRRPGWIHTVRQRLWIEAIRDANGDDAGIHGWANVCSDHFVSGKPSKDRNSPDFAPSVFTTETRSPKKRRKRSPHQKKGNLESEKTLQGPRPSFPSRVLKTTSSDILNGEQTVALDVKKGFETSTEEAAVETHLSNTVKAPPQVMISSQMKLPAGLPDLHEMNPVLHLKRFDTPTGVFHCDGCDQGFADVPQLVAHVQRWHCGEGAGASPPRSVHEDTFSNKASSPQHGGPHQDQLLLPCNVCDRSFETLQSLKRHKLLHVRDNRKCRKCGTLFCRRHNHVFIRLAESETKIEDEESAEDEEGATAAENENPGGILNAESALIDDNDGSGESESDDDGSSGSDDDGSSSSSSDGGDEVEDEGITWDFLPLLSVYAKIKKPAPGPPQAPPPPSDSLPAIPLPLFVQKLNHSQCQFAHKPAAGDAPFFQPHLPVWPDLPSSLELFSPQRLTSAFLEVHRDRVAICMNRKKVEEEEEEELEVEVVVDEEEEEVEVVTMVKEPEEPEEPKEKKNPSKSRRSKEKKKGVTDFIFVI